MYILYALSFFITTAFANEAPTQEELRRSATVSTAYGLGGGAANAVGARVQKRAEAALEEFYGLKEQPQSFEEFHRNQTRLKAGRALKYGGRAAVAVGAVGIGAVIVDTARRPASAAAESIAAEFTEELPETAATDEAAATLGE